MAGWGTGRDRPWTLVGGRPGWSKREPGGSKIVLGGKGVAEGDGGRRWPARGLEWEGVDAVGRGRRAASLAERLGDDDDVPRSMGASQGSTRGGKRGRKGGGKGGVVATARGRLGSCGRPTLEWFPVGGGLGRGEDGGCGRPTSASSAGASSRAAGSEKNWERGKKVDREEQRAGRGAGRVQGSKSTLSSTRSTMTVKKKGGKGSCGLRPLLRATGTCVYQKTLAVGSYG